jgi:Na+/proline symporter
MLDALRTIPSQQLLFFSFLLAFLWTTMCSQCVINATTRAAKQVWALMLYVAVWALLVVFLLGMGLYK